jgi:hypothetical protein
MRRTDDRSTAVDFWDAFFLLLIYIPLLLIWAFALFDIFRRSDLSGWKKALWVAVIVLIPFFGTLIYLVARPTEAVESDYYDWERPEPVAARGPAPTPTPTDNRAQQLEVLAALHDRGKLDDAEFAAAKARVLQGNPSEAALT